MMASSSFVSTKDGVFDDVDVHPVHNELTVIATIIIEINMLCFFTSTVSSIIENLYYWFSLHQIAILLFAFGSISAGIAL